MFSSRSFLLASLALSVGLSTQTPTSSPSSDRPVPYVNSGAPPLAGNKFAVSPDGTRTGITFALEDPLSTDSAVGLLQLVSDRLGFTSSKCTRVVSRSGATIFNEDRCPSTATPKPRVPTPAMPSGPAGTPEPTPTPTDSPTDTPTVDPTLTSTSTPTPIPGSGASRFAQVLDALKARSSARRGAVSAQTTTTTTPPTTRTRTAAPGAPVVPNAPPVVATFDFQAVAGSGVVVYSDGKVCYTASSCTYHYTLWMDGVEAAKLEALAEDVATVMASVIQSLGLKRSGPVSYRVVSAEQAYVASPQAAVGIRTLTPTAKSDGKSWLTEAVEGYWWVAVIAVVCFLVGAVCECVRQSCTRTRNRVKTYPMLR